MADPVQREELVEKDQQDEGSGDPQQPRKGLAQPGRAGKRQEQGEGLTATEGRSVF